MADFEATNNKLDDEDSIEVDDIDHRQNKKVSEHNLISGRFIVLANNSKLEIDEKDPGLAKV